jgi:hypothetical protein
MVPVKTYSHVPRMSGEASRPIAHVAMRRVYKLIEERCPLLQRKVTRLAPSGHESMSAFLLPSVQ